MPKLGWQSPGLSIISHQKCRIVSPKKFFMKLTLFWLGFICMARKVNRKAFVEIASQKKTLKRAQTNVQM
jgi:hypothetical protein